MAQPFARILLFCTWDVPGGVFRTHGSAVVPLPAIVILRLAAALGAAATP
jgi:hypothetical protein